MNFSTFQYLFRYSVAKKGAVREFRQAIKNQVLQPEQLDTLAWEKTYKLLLNAFQNVPWYREQFTKAGVGFKDLKNPEVFNNIPILSRENLIDSFDQFISEKTNSNKLKISTTGGSTGTPLKIGMDPKLIREIPKWQMFSWWGLSPASDVATIYRGIHVSELKKFVLNAINWPQKIVRMDATNISHQNIKSFISHYRYHSPKVVHGYVGAIDAIADYIIENNIKIPAPKVIWTTAAPITAIQTAKIEKAFGAPICDQYGCSELYFIAAECPHKQGLHIFADSVKVEILDEYNKPVPDGEYGKIVITNLNDHSFPLIRYQNGDKGRILSQRCSCGLTLPLLDKVKGRISDNIVLPDGTILSGEYLTTIFDDYTTEIKQFQIIQKKSGKIIVKVVFHNSAKNHDFIINNVYDELQRRINKQCKLIFEKVNSIPSSKGKLQFIVKEK